MKSKILKLNSSIFAHKFENAYTISYKYQTHKNCSTMKNGNKRILYCDQKNSTEIISIYLIHFEIAALQADQRSQQYTRCNWK